MTLHLSEVKGPVMDKLKRSHFLEELTGKVYLDQFEAMSDLDAPCARSAARMPEPDQSPDGSPLYSI